MVLREFRGSSKSMYYIGVDVHKKRETGLGVQTERQGTCLGDPVQAISYCGLCGAEKSSADKMMRTPISKQRNGHIQTMRVEAARLAPRYSPELAELYERERQCGNANRATLAVARKMVAHMLAVDRRKADFMPAGGFKQTAAA